VDEGSTNGTRVNELLLVTGRAKALRSHDLVDLGGYRLTIDVGVPVSRTMSTRLTADYAQRMLFEQLGDEGGRGIDAELEAMQTRPDQPMDLLPIPKEVASEPPPPRESRPSRPRQSRSDSEPATEPVRLGRSEVAVYALAAVVIATSIVAMSLLMRP
jgi:hypothetical protein